MTTFPLWYAQYPRKVARAAAEKAWSKLTLPERKQALDALPDHVRRWRLLGTEWEWLPHPASWINAKRFLDELPNNGGGATSNGAPLVFGRVMPAIDGITTPPPLNGASAQPANAHGCRGSQSPACPTSNVESTVRLSDGPKSMQEIFSGMKQILAKR